MKKKTYAAPSAELILLAPTEAVTAPADWSWTWKWGNQILDEEINASIQGTNQLWLQPWIYDSEDKTPQ